MKQTIESQIKPEDSEFDFNRLKDDAGIASVNETDIQDELSYLRDYGSYVKEKFSY